MLIHIHIVYFSRLPRTSDWALIIITRLMGRQAMTSFRRSFFQLSEHFLTCMFKDIVISGKKCPTCLAMWFLISAQLYIHEGLLVMVVIYLYEPSAIL